MSRSCRICLGSTKGLSINWTPQIWYLKIEVDYLFKECVKRLLWTFNSLHLELDLDLDI